MIPIYSVAEAQSKILRRNASLEPEIPAGVRQGIRRVFGEEISPETAVTRILADVRQNGDAALRDWTEKIDGVHLEALTVPAQELATASANLAPELRQALELAIERIRDFHQHQPLPSWEMKTGNGNGRLGQRITPLKRVGIYVPGGTAPLPSSLLMAAIPAQVAGVPEIVVATPPQRQTGHISPVILAAAHLAGISTVYPLGGAQAIAALAYGTESIPRVAKIVGPGNLFVTLAKQKVYGQVGIDGLYGPTETVVIADDTANPAWVAADLLAQAEHDLLAVPILFTPSQALATAVQREIAQQIETLSRAEIIAGSLANQGGIVLTADLAEAAQLADEFAPEHLCLAVADPAPLVAQIHHAGGLFIGERSFEVLGDYVAGPSHVMPTGGTARFASPLSALDFVRLTSIIELDSATAAALSGAAAVIAEAEGLTAHAEAARKRMKQEKN